MATAAEIVTPNSKKNLPMIPCMKIMGRKIAMMAVVAAVAAKLICRAPALAPSFAE